MFHLIAAPTNLSNKIIQKATGVNCRLCGKGFHDPHNLNDHFRNVHTFVPKVKYSLKKCLFETHVQQILESHKEIHLLGITCPS